MAIHSNPNLTDGERFQYLNTLIEDEPQHYISRLPKLEGNYQEAWSILLSHYDNPILILQHHYKRVQKDGRTLCQLYATFKQHLAGTQILTQQQSRTFFCFSASAQLPSKLNFAKKYDVISILR